MSKISDIEKQALLVRDATEEGENTAFRVGTAIYDLIKALISILPGDISNDASFDITATPNNIVITHKGINSNAEEITRQTVISEASLTSAGLLSSENFQALKNIIIFLDGINFINPLKSSLDEVNRQITENTSAITTLKTKNRIIGFNAKNGIDINTLDIGNYTLHAKGLVTSDPKYPIGEVATLMVVQIRKSSSATTQTKGAFLFGYCAIGSDNKIIPSVTFRIYQYDGVTWGPISSNSGSGGLSVTSVGNGWWDISQDGVVTLTIQDKDKFTLFEEALNLRLADKIDITKIGRPNGVCPLDADAKIPNSNLHPLENGVINLYSMGEKLDGTTLILIPPFGSRYDPDTKKIVLRRLDMPDVISDPKLNTIYINNPTSKQYCWVNNNMKLLLPLGDTPTTAYPGDKGKKNAEAISNLTLASSDYATHEELSKVSVDTTLYYNKTQVDKLVEAARISLNLTPEQLAGLTVNLTPINEKIAEVRLFSVKDKKLLVIGDSLSSSGGGSMEVPAIGSWCQYVKNNLSLNSLSRSIANGGATVTDKSDTTLQPAKANWSGSANVLSNQIYSLLNHYKTNKGSVNEFTPDIIMIMAGTNNILTSYPCNSWDIMMGDWDEMMYNYELIDSDYTLLDISTSAGLAQYNKLKTFRNKMYGAWRWCIETLLTNFPNSFIYIMQPLQNSNGRGKNLYKYYEFLEKIAKFYSLPLIRCADECSLSYFSNMRSGKGWSGPWYTFDGTHPDWQGMKLVGNYVSTIIRNTYYEKPVITATKTNQIIEDKYYNITITNANADATIGSVSPDGVQSVKEGASLTVTIAPCAGYKVLKLTIDDVSITPVTSYTFSNVVAMHTLLVEFALNSVVPPITHEISASVNNVAMGTVVPALQVINDGATATITASAKNGYQIESWEGADSYTGLGETSGTANVENVKTAKIIKCSFKTASVVPEPPASKTILSPGWPFDENGQVVGGITKMRIQSLTTVSKLPIGDFCLNGHGIINYDSVVGATTGNNSGIYPDEFLLKSFVINGGTSAISNGDVTISNMANGTYRIGILTNISSAAKWANYIAELTTVSIDINGIVKNPIKIRDNTDKLQIWENVIISNGVLRMQITLPSSKYITINSIEIEKII